MNESPVFQERMARAAGVKLSEWIDAVYLHRHAPDIIKVYLRMPHTVFLSEVRDCVEQLLLTTDAERERVLTGIERLVSKRDEIDFGKIARKLRGDNRRRQATERYLAQGGRPR